jgi:hypothetical protein
MKKRIGAVVFLFCLILLTGLDFVSLLRNGSIVRGLLLHLFQSSCTLC